MPGAFLSSQQKDLYLERWKLMFLDVLKTARRLDLGIACHPNHKSEMMDMIEEVVTYEQWPGGDPPPLVLHRDVPPGQYMYIDKQTMETLSSQAALKSGSGLGRFSKLWTPGEGLRRMD